MNILGKPTDFYWQYEMPNFESFRNQILSDISSKEKFTVRKRIHQDLDDSTWVSDCNVQVFNELNIQDYIPFMAPVLNDWSNDVNFDIDLDPQSPWINVYERGGFQEQHDHWPCDLVSVWFFSDVNEDSGNFYFMEDSKGFVMKEVWHDMIYKELKGKTKFFPNVKAGSVLLFPSHILHGVTHHRDDNKRISMSCNFNIKALNPID